jgi:hypothetical protein
MNAGNPAHLWRLQRGESLGIFGLPRLARSLARLLPLKIQLSRKRLSREPFAVSRSKRSRMNTCAKFGRNSSEMNTYAIVDLRSSLE